MSPNDRPRLPGLFITGTDTGIGKTTVAVRIVRSLVARGLRVGVYKPAASGGLLRDGAWHYDDPAQLWQAAGRPRTLAEVCPQCFPAPLAPHLAAVEAGRTWDARLLRDGLRPWLASSDVVVVEGAGGLLSPLGEQELVADLAWEFAWPLVIVAANRLGTINATLQTVLVAGHYRGGLPLGGVVLNDCIAPDPQSDPSIRTNQQELVRRLTCPLLTRLAWQAESFERPVDWWELAAASCRPA